MQVKLEKESLLSINAVVTIHNDSHTIQQRMNVVMEKFLVLEAVKGRAMSTNRYDSSDMKNMSRIKVSILNHFSYSVSIQIRLKL